MIIYNGLIQMISCDYGDLRYPEYVEVSGS